MTYPASCRLTLAAMYVPGQASDGEPGAAVRAEVEAWIARAEDFCAKR